MSHSPGPWRWKTDLQHDGYPDDVAVLLDVNDAPVCDFGDATQYYPTEGTPPSDQDAKLIAAAPTMLALLEWFVSMTQTNPLHPKVADAAALVESLKDP